MSFFFLVCLNQQLVGMFKSLRFKVKSLHLRVSDPSLFAVCLSVTLGYSLEVSCSLNLTESPQYSLACSSVSGIFCKLTVRFRGLMRFRFLFLFVWVARILVIFIGVRVFHLEAQNVCASPFFV